MVWRHWALRNDLWYSASVYALICAGWLRRAADNFWLFLGALSIRLLTVYTCATVGLKYTQFGTIAALWLAIANGTLDRLDCKASMTLDTPVEQG